MPSARDFGELSRAAQAEGSVLILHFDKTQCPEPVEGSGAFYTDLKIGIWRRRTYQMKWKDFTTFV